MNKRWTKWWSVAMAAGLWMSATPALAQDEGAESQEEAPNAETLLKKGDAFLKKGEWKLAAKTFRQVLEADPSSTVAYKGLGRALIKRKDWDDAIKVYKDAQKKVPDWNEAIYRLAYIYRKKGDYAQAISFYEQYRDLEPDNPDAYYGLGQALRKDDQPKKALAAFQAYVDKEKRPGEQKWIERARQIVTALEGEVGAEQKNTKSAKGTKTGAASGEAISEAKVVELLQQGDRAFNSENLTRAAQLYQAATKGNVKGVEAHYKYGVVLALRGDLPAAVASWQQVLELDPSMKAAKDNVKRARKKMNAQAEQGVDDPALTQDLAAQTLLAKRYIEEGRLSMAMRVLDPLVDKNPESFEVRVMRGQALMRLGRLEEAKLNLELALGMDPGKAEVLASLGQIYLRLGDENRALYFLHRYLERADPEGRDSALEPTRRTVARLKDAREP